MVEKKEKKKPIKISLKTFIIINIFILLIIFGLIFIVHINQVKISNSFDPTRGNISKTKTTNEAPTNSNTSYSVTTRFIDAVDVPSDIKIDNSLISSNDELKKFLYDHLANWQYIYVSYESMVGLLSDFVDNNFNDSFFKNNNLEIVMNYYSGFAPDYYGEGYPIKSVVQNGTEATINMEGTHFSDNLEDSRLMLNFITLDKSIKNVDFKIYMPKTEITILYASDVARIKICILAGIAAVIIVSTIFAVIKNQKKIKDSNDDESNDKKEKNSKIKKIVIGIIILVVLAMIIALIVALTNKRNYSESGPIVIEKPIIYLYPTEETEVKVQLENEENITVSYPDYGEDGWDVIAKPNGDLINKKDGRSLYSLYYESEDTAKFKVEKDGFIVKGSDIAKFLEEKLAILGLTQRESEEFIVYWLPKLQANKYNYIRFATMDEINKNMPLKFSVKPDTLIRVLMTYKALDEPIQVEEQQLETPERTGFVAVEWGGTEIK